ncbi:diguanylate cyclase [Ancylobacter sp. 6x-1]|uniref:diguanylate cyclase n=1 Tax=Ancylobacter crimeensis TaxID=2579147 RepID=A0ABT0DER2_9HYPH|nr:GGDEF domain-containing protein [Ancylobacter crimeensis]MCK0198449.1 diguanylate cyclase [Ancylobacter crimeensis]
MQLREPTVTTDERAVSDDFTGDAWRRAALLGLAVFVWALLGIITRPGGHLAAFWPANALMLGALVRFPRLVSRPSWLTAAVGYIAADLITGNTFTMTMLLTAANLSGVAMGYLAFGLVERDDRRLARPNAVLAVALVSAAASAAAGVTGAIITIALYGGAFGTSWLLWFITELLNYIVILPVMLTFPQTFRWPASATGGSLAGHLLPFLALIASTAAGMAVGGPGALAFPVPALLWCAISYSLFTSSVLNLLFSAWSLLAIASGILHVTLDPQSGPTLLSIRLGINLIALAPLMVASAMQANAALLDRMSFMANHDPLTRLPNRISFSERAMQLLDDVALERRSVAMLMLDIDRFKTINDSYGHQAGDRVLVAFARLLEANVRQRDALARMGGEEFAILLCDCTPEDATTVAERICRLFAEQPIDIGEARWIHVTVSIGISTARQAPSEIGGLLQVADEALYAAKDAGRNRVIMRDSMATAAPR